MSGFKSLIFVSFLLSFVAFACSLESICKEENAFECLSHPTELADYQICIRSEWVEFKCRTSESCLENACVPTAELCEESGTRCLDLQNVENCTKERRPKVEACGRGLFCDAEACEQGKECCAAFKPCEKTETRCLDLQNSETCTLGGRPKVVSCGEGFTCDAGACEQGLACCVSLNACKETRTRCLDLQNVEICTAWEQAKVEACGEGFICDAVSCGQGLACCVIGEICREPQRTCVDKSTVKICVKGETPSRQICNDSEKCEAGNCIEDVCANGRLDTGEGAVDCGGSCAPCVSCRVDADCGVGGFCDSASGYVCSKRCRTSADCHKSDLWDGDFCRGDGRCAPKVFETVWELTAEDPTVVLPFDATYPNAKCDFQILWGDEPKGTDMTTRPRITDCKVLANVKHSYARAGSYAIKIIGTYDGWGAFEKINMGADFGVSPAATKLRAVSAFGPVGLSYGAFHGASELRLMPPKDVPDASKLRRLASAFAWTFVFDAPIGHWDTSQVADMSSMFGFASVFNQPIDKWNTSKVTTMNSMFSFASVFNQPLAAWNTAKVTDMRLMFSFTTVFNQSLSSWDVSQVVEMGGMFSFSSAFDQDLSAWRLAAGVKLENMFGYAFISEAKLCLLKAKGGAWLKQWGALGKLVTCK